jgi:predicted phosphodiesterase
MKILLLSDSHGNRFGLQAVLDYATNVDVTLCLGDVVGYGAHPNECCELLRERKAICLSGNHDAAALGKIDDRWFNPIAQYAIRWTAQQLSLENRTWLDLLPAYQDFKTWNIEAVHASLREPWEEYIFDKDVAAPNFLKMQRSVLFFGHTHQAVCTAISADPKIRKQYVSIDWQPVPAGGEIELSIDELSMVNPGSCGQPRDGNPLAKGVVYDTKTRTVEFFGVQYDVEAARQAIIDADLPHQLGNRLLQGI